MTDRTELRVVDGDGWPEIQRDMGLVRMLLFFVGCWNESGCRI